MSCWKKEWNLRGVSWCPKIAQRRLTSVWQRGSMSICQLFYHTQAKKIREWIEQAFERHTREFPHNIPICTINAREKRRPAKYHEENYVPPWEGVRYATQPETVSLRQADIIFWAYPNVYHFILSIMMMMMRWPYIFKQYGLFTSNLLCMHKK